MNLRALGIALALALSAGAWAEEAGKAVQVDLPTSGRLGAIAPVLQRALGDTSLAVEREVTWADLPAAVVLYSGNPLTDEQQAALTEHLAGGGGLVYLFGTTSRHAEPAAALAGSFGITLEIGRGPRRDVELGRHPALAGVRTLPTATYDARMSGPGLTPLARQGSDVIAGAAGVQRGRLALLPLTLVTLTGDEAPTPDQTRLLANACLWAAGLDDELADVMADRPHTVRGPDGLSRTMRAVLLRFREGAAGDFGGAALVDILAADDNWDLIADALEEGLRPAGLPVRHLASESAAAPLAQALESGPALVAIGGTRRLDSAEIVAVANFVRLGGRVMIVAHAATDYVVRLIDINALLREFNVAVAMGRSSGPTVLEDHPITDGLATPPAMASGLAIWSPTADPLARVGRRPYMAAVEAGDGRVVVLDAKLLLAGTRAFPMEGVTPATSPFAPLFQAALVWLLEKW